MNKTPSGRRCGIPFPAILGGRAQAAAKITGGEQYPDISGTVCFYPVRAGVLVRAEVSGLPHSGGAGQIFGFHIHKGTDCGGTVDDPFGDAMSHFDPDGHAHPYHAGDLPPLFGNDGYALSVFLTNRFSLEEVIGRTIILHDRPDDFTTQPSGNSGTKIACGVIRRTGGPCR